MLLVPSPEQEQLATAVNGALSRAGGTRAARAAEAERPGYDLALWNTLVGLGVADLATADGEHDGSLEDAGVVSFEIGRVLAPVPYLEAVILPARLALALAPGPLKEDLLLRLRRGEQLPAAVGGPGHRDECVLRSGTIQGEALLVRAIAPGPLLQVATDSDGAPVLCLVDLGTAHTEARSSIGKTPLIDIHYDAVRLIDSAPLLALDRALDETHAITAAWWAGAARALIDLASHYAKERHQFGQSIGGFQAIQHRLADMAVDGEAARLMAFRACAMASKGALTERDALEAWLIAGEAARRCAAGAHQIFGGYGFTLEFDVQLFSRRVRGLQFWLTDPIAVEKRLAEILRADMTRLTQAS